MSKFLDEIKAEIYDRNGHVERREKFQQLKIEKRAIPNDYPYETQIKMRFGVTW